MPRTCTGQIPAPSKHRFWSRGGNCGPCDPATRQTRKPRSITDGTPRPHGAQSISGKSTTTAVDDEPSRKAMGCRKAPTAVRAGVSQHGRGRVGTDEVEPSRKAMGCRRAPTAVRAGVSQHGRGRVGMSQAHLYCVLSHQAQGNRGRGRTGAGGFPKIPTRPRPRPTALWWCFGMAISRA